MSPQGFRSSLVATLAAALLAGCGGERPPAGVESHADLSCAGCHTGTGDAVPVRASTDAACVRCHALEELAVNVEVGHVRLSHVAHGELAEGLGTPCSACHVHESGEQELQIDEGSCFLCHARLPGGEAEVQRAFLPEAGCTDCHPRPAHTAFASAGMPVDHATVVEHGVACLQCHHDSMEGTGAVEEVSCRECHTPARPGGSLRGNEKRDAVTVHAQHFGAELAPACGRCHGAVEHGLGAVASVLGLDCRACHAPGDAALAAPVDSSAHRAQQLLYTGLIPGAERVLPAEKFVARVSCASCHSESSMRHARGSESRIQAIRDECAACHGARHGVLLDEWTRGARRRTKDVGDYVRATAAHDGIRASAGADSSARRALRGWQLVEEANGVHNIPAADELLRSALEDAVTAYARAGIDAPLPPRLGPDPGTGSCARCHYGTETGTVAVTGGTLDHDRHAVSAGVACRECHAAAELFREDGRTFDPEHGRTTITTAGCRECHHRTRETSDCATCHPGDLRRAPRPVTVHVQVGDGEALPREVEFLHDNHEAIACVECHRTPGALAVSESVARCADCHAEHHTEGRTCSACHSSDNLATAHSPPADAHRACDACHDRGTISRLVPDRSFCVTCHDPGAAHYVASGRGCTECHLLSTSEDYRSELLTGRGHP